MVIVLCGMCGTGKDTIRKELIKRGCKSLISYTSRPMREGEEDGKDYWFISKEEIEKMKNNNELMDYREYKVYNGDIWGYGHYNYSDINIFNCGVPRIVIADLKGAKIFKNKFGDKCIIVYITSNYKERLDRVLSRGDNKSEIKRRFKQDSIDFSNDKLYNVVDYIIKNKNGELNKTVNQIMRWVDENEYS